MKKLLFLLIILNSCTEKKDTIENDRIIALQKSLSKQKAIKNSLINEKNKAIFIIDSMKNNINDNFLNATIFRSFLKPQMSFITNSESLIETIFEDEFIDEPCFSYYFYNGNTMYHEGSLTVEGNDYSYIDYLWNKYDRSEESIKAYFTKQKMNFIYSLFNSNNAFTDSGLIDLTDALLLAYEETSENESVLNELYLKLVEDDDGTAKYAIIRNIRSEKMSLLLNNRKYCNNYTVEEDIEAFRVYSFWARRHHENNKEIVYKLLKDFYKNVHVNKSNENLYEEEEDYDDGYRTLDDLAITNYKEPNQTEMDTIVNSKLQIMPSTGYDLKKLKKIYQTKFPTSKLIKIHNLLGEIKGGYSGEKDINYVNSGGWENNSTFTIEPLTHDVYYVYVSSTNTIYQQLIYKDKKFEILKPNAQTVYDDDDVKIINKKQVVISGRDNNDNKTYSEIFHPNMSEGKYLHFVKVVTKEGNIFFSDIQILNCMRVK